MLGIKIQISVQKLTTNLKGPKVETRFNLFNTKDFDSFADALRLSSFETQIIMNL